MDLSSEERIQISLDKLKSDLAELRAIDIHLLRQLIHIQDSIHKLLRNNSMTRTQSCHNCEFGKISTVTSIRDLGTMVRQHSVPSLSHLSSSCSSLEDSWNNNGMFYLQDSDDDSAMEDIVPQINASISKPESNTLRVPGGDWSNIERTASKTAQTNITDVFESKKDLGNGFVNRDLSENDIQKYSSILKLKVEEWKAMKTYENQTNNANNTRCNS